MRNIDYEKLRRDLLDYYGSAMYNGFPMAMMEVIEIENANYEKLESIAIKTGFDLDKYINKGRSR